MRKQNFGALWLLGVGGLWALSIGQSHAAVYSSSVDCPTGTQESMSRNYVFNGDFATLSGSLAAVGGNSIPEVGFSSQFDYAGDRTYPVDGQLAIQNNQEPSFNSNPAVYDQVSQVPIPAISVRQLPATDRWLLSNGNRSGGAYTVWRQEITDLAPETTYLFSFYASNALKTDYEASYTATLDNPPRPGARIAGSSTIVNSQLLQNETGATGDNWHQLAGRVSTGVGQNSVILEIFDDSQGTDTAENGDFLGIAHITLRRCETVPDTDGDGLTNDIDEDDDNDGIPDCVEDCIGANRDADGDGIPNQRDLDSDNDGIYDLAESGHFYKALDPDGDGRLSGDMGSNGILNSIETSPDSGTVTYANASPNGAPRDSDGDGTPDFLDLDTDGDGALDASEGGGQDSDNNGRLDSTQSPGVDGDGNGSGTTADPPDSDNDGRPDWRDPNYQPPTTPPVTGPDTDGDGVRDNVDLDDDNDGIPDSFEGINTDTDRDGIPNRLDLDSDNDGVLDHAESGHPYKTHDRNGDGRVEGPRGANGLADALETSPDSGTAVFSIATPSTRPLDTDGDNVPDFLDVDSDNDSLTDAEESGVGADENENGRQDRAEDNVDGQGKGPDYTTDPRDSDNDGLPDLRDPDSDNDGGKDVVETGNPDEDDNGQIDNPEDNDGDGKPDNPGINNTPVDKDGNNIQDQIDPMFRQINIKTGVQGVGGGGALGLAALLTLLLGVLAFAWRRR